MSQQRTRKSAGAAIEPARGRQSVIKASGDSMRTNVQAKQPPVRSTSKSKIPKSLRYDLENALVGLCDVWFEEIKPHLVCNNIKVHVHGGGAGPASGDHQRLPPGAPDCSHLDPGAAPDLYQRAPASCADYCSTQPTASRAQCRKPPALCRPACPLPVSSPSKLRASLLNPCQNCEAKIRHKSNAPRTRRPRNQPRPQPPPQPQHLHNWRTPRLCRTYSVVTPRTNPPTRRLQTAHPQLVRRNQPKRRPKKVDKWTQTPALKKPDIFSVWQEEPWHELYRQELIRQKLLELQPRHEPLGPETCKKESYMPESYKQESSKAKDTSPSCLRCPATTMLYPSQRSRKQSPPVPPLFQEDLINIIAEKNDKQLRVLYKSPTREEPASMLNLVQLQPERHAAGSKRVPWR